MKTNKSCYIVHTGTNQRGNMNYNGSITGNTYGVEDEILLWWLADLAFSIMAGGSVSATAASYPELEAVQ